MFKISQPKKEAGVYCCAYGCSNKPVSKKGGLCHKHYRRKLRKEDPVQIRFNGFKGNAKKRNKPFHITLEEFRAFCKKTGYLQKGKRGQNATIDRRCNIHGYFIWNTQLLTNRANASKGNRPSGNCFEKPNTTEQSIEEIINEIDKEEEIPF